MTIGGFKLLKADENLLYVWKPAGLPSTFGSEESFLEMILEGTAMKIAWRINETQKQLQHYLYLPAELRQTEFMLSGEEGEEKEREEKNFSYVQHQKKICSKQEERGLVNRLDTPTAGYLYFARSRELYAQRSELQQQGKVIKHYYALVHGDIRYMRNS